jgi:hypothetical protein
VPIRVVLALVGDATSDDARRDHESTRDCWVLWLITGFSTAGIAVFIADGE